MLKQKVVEEDGDVVTRVSQEFFQTMATPKFSAFGYLKMEFIEKNKIYQV